MRQWCYRRLLQLAYKSAEHLAQAIQQPAHLFYGSGTLGASTSLEQCHAPCRRLPALAAGGRGEILSDLALAAPNKPEWVSRHAVGSWSGMGGAGQLDVPQTGKKYPIHMLWLHTTGHCGQQCCCQQGGCDC